MYKCLCSKLLWTVLSTSTIGWILVKSQGIKLSISTFLLILCHFIVKTSVYLFKSNMSSTHKQMLKLIANTSTNHLYFPNVHTVTQKQIMWSEVKQCLHFRNLFLFHLGVRHYLGNLSLYFCQLFYDSF